jgi:hypothetical protein
MTVEDSVVLPAVDHAVGAPPIRPSIPRGRFLAHMARGQFSALQHARSMSTPAASGKLDLIHSCLSIHIWRSITGAPVTQSDSKWKEE